jgi:putative transferase (TIGR04331 family)
VISSLTPRATINNDIKILSRYKKKKIICVNEILALSTFKKKNIFYPKSKIPKKIKIKKVYGYCKSKYNVILNDLFTELNKVHNLRNSRRFWEIIIGHWLIKFIYISYNNYFSCINVLKNNKFAECIAVNHKDYNLCTSNTMEAGFAANDNEWNFALNSQILNFLDKNIKLISVKPFKKNFKLNPYSTLKKNKKISAIKKIIVGFFNFFEKCKEQNVLIYNTSLPFFSEKKLELSLNQIPKFREKKKEIYSSFNSILRKKIFLKKNKCKDKFEEFLRSVLPYVIPIVYIESFKKNYDYSKKIGYPKKPRFIFTCYSYQTDELFKFYLADQTEKNVKYFCGQHGNNYFTSYQLDLSVEFNTCDNFFSWGYKNNKKTIPFFNFSLVNKIKEKRYFDKLGNLLVICSGVGNNFSPIDRFRVDKNSIKDILEITNKLQNNISKSITIRLTNSHLEQFSGYYYKNFFSNTKFHIDLNKENLRELQKKSRLNLFNYYSTGMLENLLLNIPSICYLQKDFELQNNFFQKKVNFLVDANIVFYDKKKILNHVNKIWNNVDDWWLSRDTKNLINKFNKDFNLGDNSINKLKNFLIKC